MNNQPRFSFAGNLAILALAAAHAPAAAGYTTDQAATGTQLVASLLAPSSGITIDASSIVTIGEMRQHGGVLSFDVPQRPLGPGIGLSTGRIASWNEPGYGGGNFTTGTGGHAGISAARYVETFDQGVLRFSFQVASGVSFVTGLMVFGSAEYPVWLGNLLYGDGVLIQVDGVDASAIDGQPFSMTTVHQRFGMDPDPPGAGRTGWSGLTPLLRFTAALDPHRSVHGIEFAIAETSDAFLDSALFVSSLRGLEAGQGTPGIALAVPEPGTWALLLCGLGPLMGKRRAGRLPAAAESGPALPE